MQHAGSGQYGRRQGRMAAGCQPEAGLAASRKSTDPLEGRPWATSLGAREKDYREIVYETGEGASAGIAKITINRPERRNAFTPLTVNELYDAFTVARDDASVGVIILTGANHGDRHEDEAFCSGGDQKIRGQRRLRGRGQHPAPERAGPAAAHPRGAEARHRHGERLRHWRRARAAHPVRFVHCGRNGQVRADRPQGGQLRRRLRRGVSGRHRGGRRRRARYGTCAASTRLPRRWTWAW